MPTGPQGQKRRRDVNACAVTVMKIATGQIEEKRPQADRARSAGIRKAGAETEIVDEKL